MQPIIRAITTALLTTLLLATPAWANPEEAAVDSEVTATEREETASTSAAAADTDQPEDQSELKQPVIYVPPSRGSVQARVGGATRGGEHPF